MRVAVIGGGPSPEAEVSRRSAAEVVNALSDTHDAHYIEFDGNLNRNLCERLPDVVFPVLHGVPGEDGTIQGYLASIGLPFVGSELAASALAINKFVAKQVWKEHGLPVLPMCTVDRASYNERDLTRIQERLGSSVAIKPREQGSALGVHLLPDGGDIHAAIEDTFRFEEHLIVEPYKRGREITVAVLELGEIGCFALPIIEIQVIRDGEWYDFTNRYKVGASRHVIDPPFPPGVAENLKHCAVLAHQTLGCRDLSRADFIVEEDGSIWLLEINTIPGMTETSLYPDAARAGGYEFPELLSQLIRQSALREGNRLDHS